MNRILFDTDIVIWLLKAEADYMKTFLQAKQQGYEFLLSPIVSAEIYAGAFKKEYETIEKLFVFFTPIVLDNETGKLAGEYANQYRKAFNKISLEDYLLAASAYKTGALLWTNNQKHYPMPEIRFFSQAILNDE